MNGTDAQAFVRDLFAGKPGSPAAWRAYFNSFHEAGENPGRSNMLRLRDEGGLDTLTRLAAAVPPQLQALLDIGSGAGALVPVLRTRSAPVDYTGVDLCSSENARAQAQFGDAVTQFVTADALAMPFAAESFDGVISHFALMLVEPIDDALQEIRRVLRPGGTLAFLTENRSAVQREPFAAVAAQYLRSSFPNMAPPVTNRSVRSAQTLVQKLADHGFENVVTRDVLFAAPLAPHEIADLVTSFYIYGSLDDAHSRELRSLLLDAAQTVAEASGRLLYEMPTTLFTATLTHSKTAKEKEPRND